MWLVLQEHTVPITSSLSWKPQMCSRSSPTVTPWSLAALLTLHAFLGAQNATVTQAPRPRSCLPGSTKLLSPLGRALLTTPDLFFLSIAEETGSLPPSPPSRTPNSHSPSTGCRWAVGWGLFLLTGSPGARSPKRPHYLPKMRRKKRTEEAQKQITILINHLAS